MRYGMATHEYLTHCVDECLEADPFAHAPMKDVQGLVRQTGEELDRLVFSSEEIEEWEVGKESITSSCCKCEGEFSS